MPLTPLSKGWPHIVRMHKVIRRRQCLSNLPSLLTIRPRMLKCFKQVFLQEELVSSLKCLVSVMDFEDQSLEYCTEHRSWQWSTALKSVLIPISPKPVCNSVTAT